MNLDRLGIAIKECREARGRSREELAERINAGNQAAGIPRRWYVEGITTIEEQGLWDSFDYQMVEIFSTALNIPESVLVMLAAPDTEIGVSAEFAAQFRQAALDLLKEEE